MKKKHTSTKWKINPVTTHLKEKEEKSKGKVMRANPFTHFERFISEHNEFINHLAQDLDRPLEEARVIHALKAVLHTLRDRLTLQKSFHILSQFPAFLKLYYIEGWKYLEKPVKYHSIEEFCEAVELHQYDLGERQFPWEKSTEEIVNITLASLRRYLDDGSVQKIFAEMPPALQPLFA